MSRWPMYRIHKWFAVTVGGFILMWLVSGIVMVLPPLSAGPAPVRRSPAVDFREITLSPAQAVANLETALGTSMQVNHVSLRRILDVIVYEVGLRNGSSHLINAVSGQVFTITRELAEQIVRETFPSQARVLRVEQVDRHSYSYQWGPLPAYLVVLDDDSSTAFYVSTLDGTVRRINDWNRIEGAVESLHTFQPLKLISKQDAVRKGLLIIASLIGIAAALSGYFLALRRT